jgi:hypothetical protein
LTQQLQCNIYGVVGGPATDQFQVAACNPTGATIDPPAVNFRYVIFGF